MTPDERSLLIDSLIEGDISDADFLRIEAELSIDSKVRQEYYRRLQLTLLLEQQAQPVRVEVSREAVRTSFRFGWIKIAFIAITAAAVGFLIIRFLPSDKPTDIAGPAKRTGSEDEAIGFAIISGQSEAVWDSADPADGSLIPAGEMHLESGRVQLDLFSGVRIVVQGDAVFSVDSPMDVKVIRGRVRAHVPEAAQGFRIHTRDGEIVDLGTEFAVDVEDGKSHVQVLTGEVELRPNGIEPSRLLEGGVVRMSSQGATPDQNIGSLEIVAPDEFERELSADRTTQRDRWRQTSQSLARDPNLIAYYRVDASDRGARHLSNLAAGRDSVASAGAVVGAVRAKDRWGQTDGSLDFGRTGSRVRLHVPGQYQDLTLLCWVKINSLDRWYNSLFLTDGHELGEPHWQIMDDGRLFFSVKKNDVWDAAAGEKDKHIFYSPPFWNNSLSGRWLMLATVYDSQNKKVTHYLDGRVLSREPIPDEYLVTEINIGDASLCNWGLPERGNPRFAIRNLNGCMDEFAMFGAVVSQDVIENWYEEGKP